jgi:HPt (histidine-containing phosphotransfer) domain-containing protein
MEDERIIERPPAALAEYVPEYLAETRRQLDAACAAASVPLLKTLGHNLRGSAPAFGLHILGGIGRRLEKTALEGDPDDTLACARFIDDYLTRVEILPE